MTEEVKVNPLNSKICDRCGGRGKSCNCLPSIYDWKSVKAERDTILAEVLEWRDNFTSMKAERDKLREALKPFADLGDVFIKSDASDDSPWVDVSDSEIMIVGDSNEVWNFITVGDLRRASALLKDRSAS